MQEFSDFGLAKLGFDILIDFGMSCITVCIVLLSSGFSVMLRK